ncbi:uncharacterized protein LOC129767639 [Toxorhynchites rutilus septentrionalis]|uniref:uncharacterized protein LOC129767639 n=1 Tax=Toxorhynchites rutilus septentrionalis TaxID=329112 RepID=UPI00247AA7A4|nr:uncharacterized protein LOC129767639 [Toxorhynchites rutilus septentrionalis]XP_055624694.1 uncharacterized protein LOC129767639 [Toxorhynchites rutilus septentrionalis]XP_055624695.1 uncharacterized protein LOC129767639 [Toxorhynchites rutilus septentrionalis]
MLHLSCRLVTQGLTKPNNFTVRNQCFKLQLNLARQFSGIAHLGGQGRLRDISDSAAAGSIISMDHHQRHGPITMTTRSSSSKVAPAKIKTYSVTKNLHFYSSSRTNWSKDSQTLRLDEQLDKPLVLMFAWLQATEKHIKKFAEFYIEQGFHVLVVHLSPWQLMWPVQGSQVVAGDVVKFLRNNDLERGVVLHGFSVGGYMWGECLVKIHEDESNKLVLDKIKGQVWDSAADITEIPVGVPYAVLPKNPMLQRALRGYITYHLKLFQEEATQHYEKSTNIYHSEPVRCPSLMFVSKSDPVGTEEANRKVMASWESVGVKASIKCWDRSPHVGHFYKHHDEYVDLLLAHLSSLNIADYIPKAKL